MGEWQILVWAQITLFAWEGRCLYEEQPLLDRHPQRQHTYKGRRVPTAAHELVWTQAAHWAPVRLIEHFLSAHPHPEAGILRPVVSDPPPTICLPAIPIKHVLFLTIYLTFMRHWKTEVHCLGKLLLSITWRLVVGHNILQAKGIQRSVLLPVLPSITQELKCGNAGWDFMLASLTALHRVPWPFPATAPQLRRHAPHAFIAKILHNLLASL